MERRPYHPNNEIGKFEAAMLRLQVFALRSRCEPQTATFKTTYSLYNKRHVDLLVLRNDFVITEEILFTHDNGNTLRRRNTFHFGTDHIDREPYFAAIERDPDRNLIKNTKVPESPLEYVKDRLAVTKARIADPSLFKITYKDSIFLSNLIDSIQPADYIDDIPEFVM